MTLLLVALGCALAAALAAADGRRPLALLLGIVAVLGVAEWHMRRHGRGGPPGPSSPAA